MNNSNKPSIAHWLRRLLLLSGLLPALLVIATLAIAGALAYERLLEQQRDALRQQAHKQLRETIQLRTTIISGQLEQLSRDVASFARHVGLVLRRPASLPLQQYKAYARTPQGDLYSSQENGGFAFFYSGIKPVDARALEKLQRLLSVDPAMRDLLQRHPQAVEVFFSTHDSLQLSYPYSDPLERFTPGTDLAQSPNYYLADASHNPERVPVWAAPRRDPGSSHWLSACIAPVYRNDLLEGVVGLDVRLDALVAGIDPLPDRKHAALMLLSSDGSLIAPSADIGAADAAANGSAIELQTGPDREGALDVRLPESARTAITQQENGILPLGPGGNRLLAWSTIPQTDWKLLAIQTEATAVGSAQRAVDTVMNTLLSGALVTVLILSLTAFLLMLKSRRGADRLALPLHYLKHTAQQTADGKYLHVPPNVQFDEQQQAAQALVDLGGKLQSKAQTEARTRLALQRSQADLEKRLDSCSQELLLASHARERLETTPSPLSGYDHLTGLPAAPLFHDRAKQALLLAERNEKPLLVVLLQLSGFVPGQEPEGENTHDRLRQAIAHRLASRMRASDTVARLGHNEFAVVMFDYDAEKVAGEPGQEIAARIGMPSDPPDEGASVKAEMGLSRYPQDGDSIVELLHQADATLLLTPESERPSFTVRAARSGEE